jgi:hypothetical protein
LRCTPFLCYGFLDLSGDYDAQHRANDERYAIEAKATHRTSFDLQYLYPSRGGAMYRRGAVHILVLVLVVLVGSAAAQQLSGSQLLVSGNGPHAVGGNPDFNAQFLVRGTFRSIGNTHGFRVDSTQTPGVNALGAVASVHGAITKASSGIHTDFVGLQVETPTINDGAAAVSNASTVKITGAPYVAGANNYALWVAGGSTKLGGTLHVGGDARFDGNIAAKYQDLAEWVPSTQALAAGTVAIVDIQASNRVVMSEKPYDTRVAGVVSTQPGILLGQSGADKVKVAHSGRVKVSVDARYGAIAVGDLLVTSATPGHAMRSEPVNIGGVQIHRPGTLVGKALEPLETGQGQILVLLVLQ